MDLISDHLPIYVCKKKNRNKKGKKCIIGRSYKKYSVDHLVLYMSNLNRDYVERSDVNLNWIDLMKQLKEYLDRYYPIRNFQVPIASNRWIDKEVMDLINKRCRLLRIRIRIYVK